MSEMTAAQRAGLAFDAASLYSRRDQQIAVIERAIADAEKPLRDRIRVKDEALRAMLRATKLCEERSQMDGKQFCATHDEYLPCPVAVAVKQVQEALESPT